MVLGVETLVGGSILLGLFGQVLEETIGQRLAQLAHQVGVLHPLAGDVERQVLAVDHTANKPQPLREKPLRLGIDEYLAAIQMNLGLLTHHSRHFETA